LFDAPGELAFSNQKALVALAVHPTSVPHPIRLWWRSGVWRTGSAAGLLRSVDDGVEVLGDGPAVLSRGVLRAQLSENRPRRCPRPMDRERTAR
jgi:hypothetical protein